MRLRSMGLMRGGRSFIGRWVYLGRGFHGLRVKCKFRVFFLLLGGCFLGTRILVDVCAGVARCEHSPGEPVRGNAYRNMHSALTPCATTVVVLRSKSCF